MARRYRILIYTGDQAWLDSMKKHDAVQEGRRFRCAADEQIVSADIPEEMFKVCFATVLKEILQRMGM